MYRDTTRTLALGLILIAGGSGCSSPPDAGTAGEARPLTARAATGVAGATTPSGYVHVPGGRLVHESCVHTVGAGESVDMDGNIRSADGTVRVVPPCRHARATETAATTESTSGLNPLHPNVQESENWTAGSDVGLLTANLTVPPSPVMDNDYVGFYIDLEHDSLGHGLIAQLMYIGQDQWALETDYIVSGSPYPQYYSSSPITGVGSGDSLFLAIQGLSGAGNCQSNGACKWVMTAEDRTQGETTSISAFLDVPFRWVWGGAMDASNITNCNQLPSSTVRFENITIKKWGEDVVLTPSVWTPSYNTKICGRTPSGVSASEVEFTP
jgi:hypothetical protein